MAWDDMVLACRFACRHAATTVLVSGGEPTCHPDWRKAVRLFSKNLPSVLVSTNGSWIGTSIEEEMTSVLKECPNVGIQISSFPGLYPQYERVASLVPGYLARLEKAGLSGRASFESSRALIDSKMLALGRACEHDDLKELAAKAIGTTSCISSLLIAAQLPFDEAIVTMELHGKFCRPMIDYKGGLHWSESILCPPFANIHDPDEVVVEKAKSWRPCGSCAGYAKLMARQDEGYVRARRLLGLQLQ